MRLTTLKKRVGRWLFTMPQDRSLFWSIERPDSGPHVDICRFGACEFRALDRSHTVTGGIGWPLGLQEALAERGVGLGFQNVWTWNLSELPTDQRTLLKRRRLNRGAPDVVWIQGASYYSIRHVFGFHRRIVGLRENAGRWVGGGIFGVWRVVALLLRLFGRTMPPPPEADWERLDTFVRLVQETWPNARIGIQGSLTMAFPGPLDPRQAAQIETRLRAFAHERGLDWIPTPELGTDMAMRCANGVNLNTAGSMVAGRHYAEWILAQTPSLVRVGRPQPVGGCSS